MKKNAEKVDWIFHVHKKQTNTFFEFYIKSKGPKNRFVVYVVGKRKLVANQMTIQMKDISPADVNCMVCPPKIGPKNFE